tara:strand:+ start:3642 stop:4010 length:369 start_codon:yes stop_codon:yes gene_type:complete
MKTKIDQLIEKLETLGIDVDFSYALGNEDFEDITKFDDIWEILENNNMLEVEIIYYTKAIEFLHEYDPSLGESLKLAYELGFAIEDLNSEVLASILATDMLRSDLSEAGEKINEFINWLKIA